MKKLLAAMAIAAMMLIGGVASANPAVEALRGQGPADGEFSAWTKQMANGNQIKFYAKYMQPDQKVQFMVQNSTGNYEQYSWKRVESDDLNSDGSYKDMQNHIYFIRTLDLEPGKNRVRILVDGELVWGTKTYSIKESESDSSPAIDPSNSNPQSPSPVEMCKVPDGRPSYLQGYPRGAIVNGEPVAGGVGFPFTEGRFPVKGEANIILALVSFEDTEEFVDRPDEFLGPQSEKISEWSNFWSQGQFRYNFQIVENWVRIPMKSSEATSNDEILARQILEQFPPGIDYSSVDGTFIYWAPGLVADDHDFGIRVGSNETPFVVGEKRPGLFWAPSKWHTETTNGNLTLDLKMRYTWSHLIHEFLHEQGLNMHAPGNGWQTGLGQNQYPDPGRGLFSAALPAWELFILGWLRDDQIHCLTDKDLVSQHQATLTPLEISGGDRKALVVETAQSDEFLVVESRRPVGYSEWGSGDKGIFVYQADPTITYQDDHSSGDCGNDPRFPKWSYYLFPDSAGVDPSSWCGDFRIALVREGDKVTHNGIEISLAKSTDKGDVVTVRKLSGLIEEFSLPENPIDNSPRAQIAEKPWLRTDTRQSHCYCCGCIPTLDSN